MKANSRKFLKSINRGYFNRGKLLVGGEFNRVKLLVGGKFSHQRLKLVTFPRFFSPIKYFFFIGLRTTIKRAELEG